MSSELSGKAEMAMDAGLIESLIKEGIPDADVRIEDLRGDGDHYAAYVESRPSRARRIQRHKMVYDALQGRMGGELHALALQTSVPKDTLPGYGPVVLTRISKYG